MLELPLLLRALLSGASLAGALPSSSGQQILRQLAHLAAGVHDALGGQRLAPRQQQLDVCFVDEWEGGGRAWGGGGWAAAGERQLRKSNKTTETCGQQAATTSTHTQAGQHTRRTALKLERVESGLEPLLGHAVATDEELGVAGAFSRGFGRRWRWA